MAFFLELVQSFIQFTRNYNYGGVPTLALFEAIPLITSVLTHVIAPLTLGAPLPLPLTNPLPLTVPLPLPLPLPRIVPRPLANPLPLPLPRVGYPLSSPCTKNMRRIKTLLPIILADSHSSCSSSSPNSCSSNCSSSSS